MRYNSKIKLGKVILSVENLEKQVDFYKDKIGLEILEKRKNEVDLGIKEDNLILITLKQIEGKRVNSSGLYHLAILVPSRKDLGNVLRHFVYNEVELIGASNHGYSEAIYLEDTEGNGIEIYRDLDVSHWDIRENGNIIGITEMMDANGVYDSGDIAIGEKFIMPSGTKMGHIHLTVKDAKKSSKLYQEIFSLEDKMTIPTASWIASGTYHHHLAFNNWKGSSIKNNDILNYGLELFEMIYENREEYLKTYNYIENNYKDIIMEKNDTEFKIQDRDGIIINIILENKSSLL